MSRLNACSSTHPPTHGGGATGFNVPSSTSVARAEAAEAAAAGAGTEANPPAPAARQQLEKQDSIMWTAALNRATEVLVDKPDTIAMVGAAVRY